MNEKIENYYNASMKKSKEEMSAALLALQLEIDSLLGLLASASGNISRTDLSDFNSANGLFDERCKEYFAAKRAKAEIASLSK